MFNVNKLLGMDEADGLLLCEHYNCTMRVYYRDGYYIPVTRDVRKDRIDVKIENGIITDVL